MTRSIHTDLSARVSGPVIASENTENDRGWRAATQPWNLMVDQSDVLVVVEPLDLEDVRTVVRFAADHGIAVIPQRTGHGAVTGNSAGSILLRTHRLDRLRVDPDAHRLRAEAGVLWGTAQQAAAHHGLTGTPGSSPGVGVTGYTVGGGLGWFSRVLGLGSVSATAFEVVTADGDLLRVDETHEPDLFWALRGGGGDHAVVISVELDLHPAPRLFGGRMIWDAARAREVLDAYATVTAVAPDELTLWVDLLHYPGSPDPLVAMSCTFLGEEERGRSLLRPFADIAGLLGDQRRTMCSDELGTITKDPREPSAGLGRSRPLQTLNLDVVDILLEAPVAPLLTVQLRHLGGALSRSADTPNGALADPHLVYLFGSPTPDRPADAIREHLAGLCDRLDPWVGHGRPVTLLSADEDLSEALAPASVDRLVDLKEKWDPAGVVRSNHPVIRGVDQAVVPR